MRRRILIAALLLGACGGEEGLSPDAVRNLPPGTATGTTHVGEYDVELRVVECRGSCGPFSVGIFTTSICDVGDVDTVDADVMQTDGTLRITTDDLPSLLVGGVDADGSFDVGGYATQFGGRLEITARGTGAFDADGTLRGTIESRSWGDVEGNGADCYGVREITGVRD